MSHESSLYYSGIPSYWGALVSELASSPFEILSRVVRPLLFPPKEYLPEMCWPITGLFYQIRDLQYVLF